MSEPTTPADGGALTFDQATELLTPQAAPVGSGASDEAADDPAGEDTDNDQSADETSDAADASEAEEPGDGEEEADAEEEAAEPLTAPAYWSKDAKARFAELDPQLQAVVLSQEGPREAAAAKAKADAAEETKAARAQLQGVQTLSQQLNDFLPEAIETFQRRWGDPDWEATIEQYGAEQAARLKARYEKEQSQLRQVTQATQVAQTQAHQAYVLEQFQALAELDPELAPDVKDPTKGVDKRQAVSKYLVSAGVDPNHIANISAVEMTLARKAMLWDQAQAAAKAKPKAPVQPVQQQRRQTPKPGARPGGSAAAPPQSQGKTSAQNRFNSKPSIDNAVDLLMARQQG
jgi:hypothetical protein